MRALGILKKRNVGDGDAPREIRHEWSTHDNKRSLAIVRTRQRLDGITLGVSRDMWSSVQYFKPMPGLDVCKGIVLEKTDRGYT